MSYFWFHLVFTLPPLLLVVLIQGRPIAGNEGKRASFALLLITLLALLYTTPWDNYLIWQGVWHYGIDCVVGTIGFVPIEEYLFFILQPLLTGLWLYWLLGRLPEPVGQEHYRIVRSFGTVFLVVLSLTGALMLRWNHTTYLGLILVWAGPILALQWVVGARQIWVNSWAWLVGTIVPTLYLWVADRVAIAQGIWKISEEYTTGLALFSLPIEEATFFLLTNLMVVQGLLLILLLELGQLPGVKLDESSS